MAVMSYCNMCASHYCIHITGIQQQMAAQQNMSQYYDSLYGAITTGCTGVVTPISAPPIAPKNTNKKLLLLGR